MKELPENTYNKKWTGVIEYWSTEKTARITSRVTDKDSGKTVALPNGQVTMDISLSDLSKPIQRVIKPNVDREKPRKLRVRLNEDGDNVENVGPVTGTFTLKAVGLGPKNRDGEFKLKHKVYHEGEKNQSEHDEFFCAYVIQDKPYTGMEAPAFWMHYKFREIPAGMADEGFTAYNTKLTPQATQLRKLQNWMAVSGNLDEQPIRWPDDGIILPELEERLLDADILVSGVFENGYLSTVQTIEVYDDDEVTDEEVDAKFPAPAITNDEEEVEEVPAPKKSGGSRKLKATNTESL